MIQNDFELQKLLDNLIINWEDEVVEFKGNIDDSYSTEKVYRYFSALANEANLRTKPRAWLIFGIDNKEHKVVGTNFRPDSEDLQKLKHQTKQSTGTTTFINIHELKTPSGRVLLFEIPPAPRGMPVTSKGFAYARAGESLTNLDYAKMDEIRNQTIETDWSAQIIENAGLHHLDFKALDKARKDFIKKHGSIDADTVLAWDELTFLEKLRLSHDGKLTRAAILLVGKHEASYLLSPHPAQLTWKLVGEENAYEHFGLPFYLSSSALFSRIRNIQIRLLPEDSLIPVEVSKYDQNVILESVHNCIMHQDYSLNSRVIVTEFVDRLELFSMGNFFEGQPDDYIEGKRTPRRYRNTCLAQAMAELSMVDTLGQGISKIYKTQVERFFPLPDYDITDSSVTLTIHGKIVDLAYSRLLLRNTDLPISDVLALDRIQKGLPIASDVASSLRKKGLIEGRKPRWRISAQVAKVSKASHVDYVRKQDLDTDYYEQKILDLLAVKEAERNVIDDLLMDQFGTARTYESKKRRIGNILKGLKDKNKIACSRHGNKSVWRLVRS